MNDQDKLRTEANFEEVSGILEATATGDRLEIDLANGTVLNLTSGKRFTFMPYPPFILDILKAGGVYPKLTEEIRSEKRETAEGPDRSG